MVGRGQRSWLVGVYNDRDPETRKREYLSKLTPESVIYITGTLQRVRALLAYVAVQIYYRIRLWREEDWA